MSKALFRFLRGELNGYYLTNMHNALNEYTVDMKRFFITFQNQQFEEGKISEETLRNLGKFASVFFPRRPVTDTKASLYMTDSHVVNNEEFSERGLFDTESRTFDFEHTDPSITTPDINTLATESNRSSLIGDEQPEGYISQDATNVIDNNGNVRPNRVTPEPPSEGAYSEFYGNEFLFLTEGSLTYEDMPLSLFIELFKALQWIRYNGASIASLARITSLLCPDDFIKIASISASLDGTVIYVRYTYNVLSPVTNKEERLALLEYLVSLKFKQIVLSEVQ